MSDAMLTRGRPCRRGSYVDPEEPINRRSFQAEGLVFSNLGLQHLAGGIYSYDISGYDNHGTRLGTGGANNLPQWTLVERGGLVTYALHYDGTDDSVALPITPPTTATPFTWSAWCKFDGSPNSPDQKTIIAYRQSSKYLMYQERGGELYIQANGGGLSSSFGVSIDFGIWSHYVMSWDGTTMRAYKNAILAPNTFTPTWSAGTAGMTIGRQSTADEFFGQMDDARIYNRALPAGEISHLYDDSRTGHRDLLNLQSRMYAAWPSAVAGPGRYPWQIRRVRRLAGVR